jgi:tetratricopeptide (TPR) repeat protein
LATLAIYRGEQFLREVEIGTTPTRVGRAPENELVLEDRDKGVSRTHAEIRFEHGQHVIVDLNSQNGVWAGERRIKSEALAVNVPVTVGPYRLVLLPEPPPPVQAPSAPARVTAAVPVIEPPIEPTQLIESDAEPPASVTSKTDGTSKTAGTTSKTSGTSSKTAGTAKTIPAAKSAPSARKVPVVAIAGAVGVVAIALVVAFVIRSTRKPFVPETTTTTTVASTTTTVPVVVLTPEEQFQEHYTKAQALIAANDKAGATLENAEALKFLPADPRGVEQQVAIGKMKEPGQIASATTTAPAAQQRENQPTSSLSVPIKPGETPAARAAREKLARSHLDDGKKALDEKRYTDAISLLQAALDASARDDYGTTPNETATLLKQARSAKASADAGVKTAAAQKLFADAKTLANTDLAGAVRRARDARTADPSLPGVADFLTSLTDQATTQGEAALSRAKNLDAFKRFDDALKEYDRAIQLLELVPGGHKELPFAKQRSAELKSR